VAARILLASWGSHGDLYPYLGLALQLKALGRAPVLATCAYHRPIVERAGVEFRPLRPDVDPSNTDLLKRVMDPARGSEVIIRELIVPALHEQHEDLRAAARDAALIVSHPVTFAAPVVAAQLGLPWLSTVLAPLSFFSVSDFPALPPLHRLSGVYRIGGALTGRLVKRLAKRMTREWTAWARALRADAKLPPDDPLYEGQFSPYGTLALYSPVLGAPQPDWPPHTHVTGFVFYNGPAGQLPPEVAEFLEAGDPPVVFTLGSSAVGAAGTFYDESAKAAQRIGRRAVLLTGLLPANRPKAVAPSRVLVTDYAPHDLLFPRAAAVVHHGGVGTTGQALRSGRPMIVVPFAHDQPDNAYRVKRLGVARVVYPPQYNARRVAHDLRALLDDPSYAARAADVARVVRAERGSEAAADAIMSLLNEHQ
jgi:UDP:flavonoid glycosyltransferase YjiC (YdhE family)